mmetsp:Transcript_10334/g.29493  ORF Transcript_10334/g.29493 Transcript_10334/m.29493 type:complete len:248 (+) Transcript_10334:307-1050(+)
MQVWLIPAAKASMLSTVEQLESSSVGNSMSRVSPRAMPSEDANEANGTTSRPRPLTKWHPSFSDDGRPEQGERGVPPCAAVVLPHMMLSPPSCGNDWRQPKEPNCTPSSSPSKKFSPATTFAMNASTLCAPFGGTGCSSGQNLMRAMAKGKRTPFSKTHGSCWRDAPCSLIAHWESLRKCVANPCVAENCVRMGCLDFEKDHSRSARRATAMPAAMALTKFISAKPSLNLEPFCLGTCTKSNSDGWM